jgi:hypothetical protein
MHSHGASLSLVLLFAFPLALFLPFAILIALPLALFAITLTPTLHLSQFQRQSLLLPDGPTLASLFERPPPVA